MRMKNRNRTFILVMCITVALGAKCLDKDQSNSSKLISADAENLTKVQWSDSSGKKQVIVKEDGKWYYAGMEALDSISFDRYLKELVNTSKTEFIELDPKAEMVMLEKIVLFGNNMMAAPELTLYAHPSQEYPFRILASTYPDKLFLSDSNGIYRQIFLNLHQFWPDGQ